MSVLHSVSRLKPHLLNFCSISVRRAFVQIVTTSLSVRPFSAQRSSSDQDNTMFGLIKYAVKGLQKPEFDSVGNSDDYEERRYKPARWVSTTVKKISHKDATSEGFHRLFAYISGDNEKSTKVEMTAPVTTWVEPGAGPNCESSFTVSFYIPTEHQADPPKPSSPNVFIEDRPQFTAYVKKFGGFANDEIWVQKAVELGNAIGDHSKFNDAQYYTAGYDPPFKPFGRTNEVWFVKNESPLTGSSVDQKQEERKA